MSVCVTEKWRVGCAHVPISFAKRVLARSTSTNCPTRAATQLAFFQQLRSRRSAEMTWRIQGFRTVGGQTTRRQLGRRHNHRASVAAVVAVAQRELHVDGAVSHSSGVLESAETDTFTAAFLGSVSGRNDGGSTASFDSNDTRVRCCFAASLSSVFLSRMSDASAFSLLGTLV